MQTFQSVEPRIVALVKQGKEVAFMTRESIFHYLAEITCLSDEINNLVREIDLKTLELEKEAMASARRDKLSASMAALAVKQASKALKPDRDWLTKQNHLLSEMRIAALAAQRGAE